jgi:hypothetical protein
MIYSTGWMGLVIHIQGEGWGGRVKLLVNMFFLSGVNEI